MRQGLQRLGIAAHDAAPCSPIHPSFPLRSASLGLQRIHINGLGRAIQRHVHKRGDAARRSGLRRGGKALPLCSAGFVDMNMSVYQAGQKDQVAKVEQLRRLRNLIPTADGGDMLMLHDDDGWRETLRRQNASRAKYLCHLLTLAIQGDGGRVRSQERSTKVRPTRTSSASRGAMLEGCFKNRAALFTQPAQQVLRVHRLGQDLKLVPVGASLFEQIGGSSLPREKQDLDLR